MSGGSYNYLGSICYDDLQGLLDKEAELRQMADRLAGLDYAQDAARETEELLVLLRQWRTRAEVRVKRLADVWHAVEWWDSCDWSEDRVREALARYRGDTTPEPGEALSKSRRDLDVALAAAEPHAGGAVLVHLVELRKALADLDASCATHREDS